MSLFRQRQRKPIRGITGGTDGYAASDVRPTAVRQHNFQRMLPRFADHKTFPWAAHHSRRSGEAPCWGMTSDCLHGALVGRRVARCRNRRSPHRGFRRHQGSGNPEMNPDRWSNLLDGLAKRRRPGFDSRVLREPGRTHRHALAPKVRNAGAGASPCDNSRTAREHPGAGDAA